MGPETPLTRIREFMVRRVSLYQFGERPAKFWMDLKVLKPKK
jgi:hypothetical protein